MKFLCTIFILWFASLSACKNQGKVVSEDNLTAQAVPDAGDFISVLLLPPTATLAAGKTVAFEALGILPYDHSSNVSTRGTWTIANTAVLSPYEDGTPGRFRARSSGTSEVIFHIGNVKTKGSVTVTGKVLELLKLSVDSVAVNIEGLQGNYIPQDATIQVFGIYSDGSTEDLTTDAIWSSEDDSHFKSVGSGAFKVLGPATTQLHAKVNDIEAMIPVVMKSVDRHFTGFTLAPSPLILPLNTDMPLLLKANYSNGESIDISKTATYQFSNTTLASVQTAGTASLRGIVKGTGVVSISYQGNNQPYPFQVVESEALALLVTSPSRNFNLSTGDKEHFIASLQYSDGQLQNITSLATWTNGDAGILPKTGTGDDFAYYVGALSGETTITATFGAFITVKPVLVTSARLVSIVLSSANTGPLGLNLSRIFAAKGIYSDGSTRTMTANANTRWTYIINGVRSPITLKGKLPATATASQGTVTVEAAFDAIVGTIEVTVGPAVPVSIDITSTELPLTRDDVYVVRSLAAGGIQLSAAVSYSDGTTQEKATVSSWSYDILTVPNVFAGFVRNDAGFVGYMTPVATGMFTITATYQGVSATKIMSVTP